MLPEGCSQNEGTTIKRELCPESLSSNERRVKLVTEVRDIWLNLINCSIICEAELYPLEDVHFQWTFYEMTFFDTGNPPGVHKDCWCGSEAEIKAWPGNQADVLQSQNSPLSASYNHDNTILVTPGQWQISHFITIYCSIFWFNILKSITL